MPLYFIIILVLGWLAWSLLLTPYIRQIVTITGVRKATILLICTGSLVAAGSVIALIIRKGLGIESVVGLPMFTAVFPYFLLLGLVTLTERYTTAAALLVSAAALVGINAWAATELVRWARPENEIGELVVFAFVPQLLVMLGLLGPTMAISLILAVIGLSLRTKESGSGGAQR